MNDTSSRGKLVKRLMAMVVLGSLLGSLLAGGIAFAHTEIDVPKSVGSSWYETRHQQCLNHHCDFVEKSIGETSSGLDGLQDAAHQILQRPVERRCSVRPPLDH